MINELKKKIHKLVTELKEHMNQQLTELKKIQAHRWWTKEDKAVHEKGSKKDRNPEK
jgi:hypothetical protein